jgi:hypothetical protein
MASVRCCTKRSQSVRATARHVHASNQHWSIIRAYVDSEGLWSMTRVMPYHWHMKTSYIFGAILACNIVGVLVGARSTKTALLVVSGMLSVYGLVRLLG